MQSRDERGSLSVSPVPRSPSCPWSETISDAPSRRSPAVIPCCWHRGTVPSGSRRGSLFPAARAGTAPIDPRCPWELQGTGRGVLLPLAPLPGTVRPWSGWRRS